MEDGMFAASDEGAPQGGLVSPVLSNIYLHYGASGQAWRFQRVKFPPRKGERAAPPGIESWAREGNDTG